MQNFDYLRQLALQYSSIQPLAEYCCDAEALYYERPTLSAISCRNAIEWLVRSIYELKNVDTDELTLKEMIDGQPFHEFVGDVGNHFLMMINYVRKKGNLGAHGKKLYDGQLLYCLKDTYEVVGSLLVRLNMVAKYPKFDEALIPRKSFLVPSRPEPVQTPEQVELMREELPADAMEEKSSAMDFAPESISEAETRSMYIDMLLEEAGWEVMTLKGLVAAGKASIEIKVEGMPKNGDNPSGVGYCDYVLYDVDAKPLAIVEAKRTGVSAKKGRHQAELYADCMEAQYGYRPVIFYTNGFETFIQDGCGFPDRRIYGFYSLRDLQHLIAMRGRVHISDTNVDTSIAGRYYQLAAIKATAQKLNAYKRHALLVMATGTGKTRTAIALVEMLLRNNRVKNILFLADRTSLVKQAKKNFVELLPSLSVCSMNEANTTDEVALSSRMVFSTYQTMINYIDADQKLFGVGHFDLIIIDEAHRSVFGKFRGIFKYFDSLLIGLTATPREEIVKNTYDMFHLKEGEPTSFYEYRQAVNDGFLVDFKVLLRHSKVLEEGAKYADLSAAEREQIDDIFAVEEGKARGEERDISRDELFKFFYNIPTIDAMLEDVMKNGLRVDQNERLGKTIIFAFNHRCAELICERFHELWPSMPDFCQLIDNHVSFPQDIIDKFEVPEQLPQIAVSVDMLDTGIDVPQVLNIVFFKRVQSRIKFQQMIGRGTRLCPHVFGPGKDKKKFLIFDFCNVFEFFDEYPTGAEGTEQVSLTQRLFKVRLEMAAALQDAQHQQDSYARQLHDELKTILHAQVDSLKPCRIAVRDNWSLVERFRHKEAWDFISAEDVRTLDDALGPILPMDKDDLSAKTFDFVMLNIALSKLVASPGGKSRVAALETRVIRIAEGLLTMASLPEVKPRIVLLKQMTANEFWDSATLPQLERIRVEVRDLVRLLRGKHRKAHNIDIEDVITEGEYVGEDIVEPRPPYHQRVMRYLEAHGDHPVLRKIRRLEQLDAGDLRELERILWQELGTEEEYRAHCGQRIYGNVAIFIRSISGLDRQVAIDRFAQLIQTETLSATQMEYIDTIINYVSKNGDITRDDFSGDRPLGSLEWLDVFGDRASTVVQYVDEIHGVTSIA